MNAEPKTDWRDPSEWANADPFLTQAEADWWARHAAPHRDPEPEPHPADGRPGKKLDNKDTGG